MNNEETKTPLVPDAVPPGAVLLRIAPGDNSCRGLVEHSFSMDWSDDAVRFWWSGTAYSPIGTVHELDGVKDAEGQREHYQMKYPSDRFEVFDIRAPDLPIVIDWDRWLKNRNLRNEDPRRWSKFLDRNPNFKMKE